MSVHDSVWLTSLVINIFTLKKASEHNQEMPHTHTTNPCTDPESFVKGGPTLTTFCLFFFFFCTDEVRGGSKYHYKQAIIGPPAKHHW